MEQLSSWMEFVELNHKPKPFGDRRTNLMFLASYSSIKWTNQVLIISERWKQFVRDLVEILFHCVFHLKTISVINLIDRTRITFSGELGQDYEIGPIPEEYNDLVEEHRETTVMAAAEVDEELEELVIMEEEISDEKIWDAIRQATLQGHIQPVFSGSALRNWGIQALLDGILKILPSPLQRPPSKATTLDGKSVEIPMTEEGSLLALAFKVQMWDGRSMFLPVYTEVVCPQEIKSRSLVQKKKSVSLVF